MQWVALRKGKKNNGIGAGTQNAFLRARTEKGGKEIMKKRIANRLSYLGAGIGLALFAIFGLLPGSFIGGVLGLNIAGSIFGLPVEPTVLARVVIVMGMLIGVLVTGTVFIVSGAVIGWLAGVVIDAIAKPAEELKKGEKPLKI